MAQTKESKNYFVVEFRFPFEMKSESDMMKAVEAAQAQFSDQYGFIPDKWNARIFEFSGGEGTVGPQKEYFFSPTGLKIKDIAKNIDMHNERINNDKMGGEGEVSPQQES